MPSHFLPPPEWSKMLEALHVRYHVEDFSAALVASQTSPDDDTMALVIFDVEHLETMVKFRLGLDFPASLVPHLALILAAMARDLGYSITATSKEPPWPPPSASPG